MKNYQILDIKVNTPTIDKATQLIAKFVSGKNPQQIVTLNPEMVMASQKDSELKNIINNASLVVPDGIGLTWALNIIYKLKTKRVTGIDLIEEIAKLANKYRYSIFFLGAKPGIANKAATKLKLKYPNLAIAGSNAGNPKLNYDLNNSDLFNTGKITDIRRTERDPNWKIVDMVSKTKPDILLVAYGHGKQEKFIARYKYKLAVPVMMGVGGSFDFLAGLATRAPGWMQALGLEWLWRLLHEPWRFNRIITATIRFSWAVLLDCINDRLKKP